MQPKLSYTTVTGKIDGWFRTKSFWQYTAANGNSIYVTGRHKLTTKDEGNAEYTRFCQNATELKKDAWTKTFDDDQAAVDYIMGAYDEFVEYIDNYRQYKEAEAENEKVINIVREYKKAAGM